MTDKSVGDEGHMIRPSVPDTVARLGAHSLAALRRGWRATWRQVPGPCALCAQRCCGGPLCPGCWHQVRASRLGRRCACCAVPQVLRAPDSWCRDCRRDPPAFARVIIGMAYAAPADTLILQFKQAQRYGRAGLLADLLVAALRDEDGLVGLPAPRWVVPIPAAPSALRRRGFNPAGEVAADVARQLGLPLLRRTLVWRDVADYRSQHQLGRRARLERADSAFAVAPAAALAGAGVLLIDDVMTTGATLRGAASALRAAGVASVLACAVARTPPVTPSL